MFLPNASISKFCSLFLAQVVLKSCNPPNAPDVVDLGYAQYQGSLDTNLNIASYLGIRYAAAPIGEHLPGVKYKHTIDFLFQVTFGFENPNRLQTSLVYNLPSLNLHRVPKLQADNLPIIHFHRLQTSLKTVSF